MVLRGATLADHGEQVGREVRVEHPGEHLLGVQPGLDPAGQHDLLLGGEQLGAADAVEVRADQVRGDAAVVGVQIGGLVDLRLHDGLVHRGVDGLVPADRGEWLSHLHSPPRTRSSTGLRD
jgi:hypothetical protein